MDPLATGASLVASDEAKNLLARVLGPSADVAGQRLSKLLKARLDNSHKVARVAARRLRPDVEVQPVPMRVALRALDEGSYSDDEVVTEYVGGILASSRMAKNGDVANTYVSLVSRLSVTHLTIHYQLYHAIRSLSREWINVFDGGEVQKHLSTHVPSVELERVCLVVAWADDDEANDFYSALKFLERDGLLAVRVGGELEHVQGRYPAVQSPGIVVEPTVTGIELFMWGLGHGDRPLTAFFEIAEEELQIAGLEGPARGARANPVDSL